MGEPQKVFWKFWKITTLTLLVTRIISWLFFQLSNTRPALNQQFIEDAWHHYYLGVLLLLVTLIFRKSQWTLIGIAIAVGILLEELPVVIDDFGLKGARFYYLSGWDLIASLSLIGFLVLAFWGYKRYKDHSRSAPTNS